VNQLVKYDAARHALEIASTVDEAKSIKDKAAALQAYARQRADVDMERWTAEIKLRAVRRIGELSKELDKAQGGRTDRLSNNAVTKSKEKALKRAGITKMSASRFERIAEIPQEEFDAYLDKKAKNKQPAKYTEVINKVSRARNAKNIPATRQLPANSFTVTDKQTVIECDALITDPPYGILKQEWEPEDAGAFALEWLARWRGCKADFIIVFLSQRDLFEARYTFDRCLLSHQFQQLLIWHYPNNKSPQSRQMFKQTWEPIFLYRRRDSRKEIKVGAGEWGNGLNDFDCHVAAVPQSNFNGANAKVHPAQKPVEVMRWLINATTRPGELVCDPFAGSGTTGIAAVQLGRRFHGIESDSNFLELARRRINAYGRVEQSLDGAVSDENETGSVEAV